MHTIYFMVQTNRGLFLFAFPNNVRRKYAHCVCLFVQVHIPNNGPMSCVCVRVCVLYPCLNCATLITNNKQFYPVTWPCSRMAGFASQAALRSKWGDLVESGSSQLPPVETAEVSKGIKNVVGWLKQVNAPGNSIYVYSCNRYLYRLILYIVLCYVSVCVCV